MTNTRKQAAFRKGATFSGEPVFRMGVVRHQKKSASEAGRFSWDCL